MIDAGSLVAVITIIGSLVLVTRGFNSHSVGRGRMIRLGLIWLAIIAGLALVLKWLGT